jgi:GNAT superfamily N-acetyltransferase
VLNLSARYHVVLAARSISVQQYGRSSPAQLDDLKDANVVGTSLLFHPVRHLTTSLNEWIRYPPPTVTNLLERQGDAEDPAARTEQGYAGDLVARTDNTTVTFMPATPEWLADEYVEMIQFVASIPPLLTLWEHAVRDATCEIDSGLDQVKEKLDFLTEKEPLRSRLRRVTRTALPGGEGRDGDDPIRRLYQNEMRIRELEGEIRSQLAVLHSPALCRTRAQRQFLDNLWQAAGLPALERELEQRLTALAERQERMAAMVSSIEQDIRRKLERPLTIVIGLLAVASLAELFSLMNQVFDVGRPVWGGLELLILGAAAALIIVLYRYIFSKRELSPVSATPTDVVAFRDLEVDHDDELVGRFHRDVLAVSFSADELDDAEIMARGLRGEDGTQVLASVALGGDGAVLGGAVAEVYAEEGVLLLAYLAVRPDVRGHGIGTAVMEHVAPRWYAHPAVRLAIGEVHDPRRWSDVAGEDPVSRLRLFERLGARVLDVPFVQPALAEGKPRVPGFLLLAFHVDDSVEREGAVPSAIVGGFVRRYYELEEGVDATSDAELAKLLGRIEEHTTIPLFPVAEYARVRSLD